MNLRQHFTILLSLLYLLGHSQQTLDEKKGLVMVVTGGGKVSYEKAKKITEEPSFIDTVKVNFGLDYSSVDKKINSIFELETIKPPKLLMMEPLTQIRKGEIKLGINDFKTPPFFDFNYSTIRNKEYNAGIVLNHFSSDLNLESKAATRFTESNIGVYGKKINKKTTLSGKLDYDYNTFRYYGYNPSLSVLDPIQKGQDQQYYSILKGAFDVKSNKNKNTKYEYETGLTYQQLFSKYQVQEHLVDFKGQINGYYLPSGGVMDSIDFTDVSGFWDVKLNVGNLTSKDSTLDLNSTLISIKPSYKLKRKSVSLTIGLPAYFLTNNSRFLTLLPTLNFDYAVVKDILIAYAGYDMKFERKHYLTYMQDNPFIGADLPHVNTYTRFDFVGGLKGAFSSKTTFNIGGHYKDIEDFVLYVNDVNSFRNRKFNVTTDDVKHAQLFAELLFENQKINAGILAEYNNYEMNSKFAYHLPSIVGQGFAKYNVQNKFYLGAQLFYYGEQLAKNTSVIPTDPETIKLKGILDFNLTVDYKYNKRLGAFLYLNNILSTKHQRWNQYPNYGINLLGGISYQF